MATWTLRHNATDQSFDIDGATSPIFVIKKTVAGTTQYYTSIVILDVTNGPHAQTHIDLFNAAAPGGDFIAREVFYDPPPVGHPTTVG